MYVYNLRHVKRSRYSALKGAYHDDTEGARAAATRLYPGTKAPGILGALCGSPSRAPPLDSHGHAGHDCCGAAEGGRPGAGAGRAYAAALALRLKGSVMQKTTIGWCTHTVNPIRARQYSTGHVGHYCEKISDGCKHCYSSAMQPRLCKMPEFQTQRKVADIEAFLHLP